MTTNTRSSSIKVTIETSIGRAGIPRRYKYCRIPPGKIPRPKSKNFRGTEKYSTNPGRAKITLEEAKFKCELNPDTEEQYTPPKLGQENWA